MGFFDLFRRGAKNRYELEKAASQSPDVKKRLSLARHNKTHPEILYYLARYDPDHEVRLAVARNKAMPLHASPVLAGDTNEDVRLALAERQHQSDLHTLNASGARASPSATVAA